MSEPGTFKDTDIERVLNILNTTSTVTDAAKRLKTTRQTLRNYMNTNSIKRECKYVAEKVISTSAQPTTGDSQ